MKLNFEKFFDVFFFSTGSTVILIFLSSMVHIAIYKLFKKNILLDFSRFFLIIFGFHFILSFYCAHKFYIFLKKAEEKYLLPSGPSFYLTTTKIKKKKEIKRIKKFYIFGNRRERSAPVKTSYTLFIMVFKYGFSSIKNLFVRIFKL